MGDIANVTALPVDHAAGREQHLIRQLAVDVPLGGGAY